MIDAFLGFAAGIMGAVVIAAVFVLFRGVENALMPIAMLLRSVPLVALVPIISLIFGRQEPAVAAIGGIVVLFPALMTIVFGFRSASPAMLEVIDVYGGSRAGGGDNSRVDHPVHGCRPAGGRHAGEIRAGSVDVGMTGRVRL